MMCLITCGGWLLVGTILFGIWWYFDQKHGTPHMNIEPSHKIIGRVNEIYQQIQPNPSKYEPKTHQPIPRTHPASSIYSTSMPPNPIIRDHMITNQNDYDVVIMGGGAAGLLQTLHLQLYCPGIKIAIIDPLPANRTGMACDGAWDQLDATHKIGESTVFPSAAFLVRDLNLGDYLIENHPPKYGLFYLWPKQVEQTATWSDYFTMVSNRMPELPSFQLDRVKLERDLLVKILSDTTTPVTYFQGTVKQVTLTDDEKSGSTETPMIMGEAAHTVDILLNDGKTESETSTSTSTSTALSLHGSHVIDCAGRAFVIGKKKKLMTNNSSELMDIDNSSVWIHVTDYDMNLFIGDVSRGQTLSSWYYATNHFCGDGYWLWVIPIETRHGRAISIGVSFHKQVHTLNQFNTQDKFLRFLEANQNILYRIAMSGTIRLFKKLPRLAHVSSQFYSPNNWYVLGEAAYNVDPWYSTGLTWCSFQIQQTTAIVSSKLHITRAMYASQQLKQTVHVSTLNTLLNETNHLTTLYDTFAGNLVKTFLLNITRHWKHLGNASIMSWRLLMETASPQTVIGYLSKVYLCPIGCMKSTQYTDDRIWLLSGIYDILDECIDKKINIGLQDYNEPHRVPLMESTMLDLLEVDSSLRGGKYTFHSSNIPKVEAWGVLYMLLGVILLVWRALGVQGYLRPAVYQRLGYLFKSMILAYYRSWQWWFRNRHLITNQRFHKREQEFEKYQVGQTYVPW